MAIAATCADCGRRYKVRDHFAGKTVPCKSCGAMFRVPVPRDEFFDPDDRPARRRSRDGFDDYDDRRERRGRTAARPGRRSGLPTRLVVGLGIVGGVLLLTTAGLLLYAFSSRDEPESNKTASNTATDSVALPSFPAVPPPTIHPASGAKIHFVDLGTHPDNGDGPGERMTMRIYLPPGNHADKSLGCVLVAPAGTPLLYGAEMDNDDYHAETLPYVQAGYAVVFYSIDGPVRDAKNVSNTELAGAYKKFKAAKGGVVNGRNALEFVLAKLPQVDPQRIYSAGHSSAGVLSLLFAAHEPRIKACIAYAPATDLDLRMKDVVNNTRSRQLLPGVNEFLHDTSPINHIDDYNCPLFIFHARDDSNEPFQNTERFVQRLQAAGKNVTFSTTPRGNHYTSMVREGIPRAIRWLKTLPGERGKTYPTPQPTTTTSRPTQPPANRFPPRRPSTRRSRTLITFQVRSFHGRGDPETAAQRALRRLPYVDATSVHYDADKREITLGLRVRRLSTGPMKALLQREGFVIGVTRVRTR